MEQRAKKIATQASFHAFINGYLREVDDGEWGKKNCLLGALPECEQDTFNQLMARKHAWWVKLPLTHRGGFLMLEVAYRTVVGRHRFHQVVLFTDDSGVQIIPLANVISMLVREIYSSYCDNKASHNEEQELLRRIVDSEQLMARYITHHMCTSAPTAMRFIDTEQMLVFGHWQHPTPKSRQGMLEYHHEFYAPEMKGYFKLNYFQVHHSLVRQRSALLCDTEEIIASSLDTEALVREDYVVLPMHPLQAQWLLHQPYVIRLIDAGLIVDCGAHGPQFTATSSVRSLYSPALDWMFKFSLPVKITNSLRVNKRHELEAGVVMTRLYRKTGFSSLYPSFQIVADPAYITVDVPELAESGFEIIIRENSFKQGNDQDTTTLAALAQDPLPGNASLLHHQVKRLSKAHNCTLFLAAMKWFAAYWECAIEPMIHLYDEHGIALEAHQQNSVLALDQQGLPKTYYFRDNQGYYLSKSYQAYQASLDPDLAIVSDLYFDDEMICDRFCYYLMVNNLFAIIGRLGADGIVDEPSLLAFAQQRLSGLERRLVGAGKKFVQRLLHEEKLPMKANLLTRVHDIDELQTENEQSVYTFIDNPLLVDQPYNRELPTHAIA
ncbi:IucA/IucC family protein [Photobacterium minamisatsumaniensis]|uniref:IucA/IucC family protein n=1 Tax=Photobacterium minamisatsumaniensis TaxID=2910233 RepID=UPI003D0DF954